MSKPNNWTLPIVIAALTTLVVFVSCGSDNSSQESLAPATTIPAGPIFSTDDEANNIAVFEKVSPSVVFVTNKGLSRNIFSLDVTEIRRGSGSGFIWDATGLIVTNFHVVYRASKITITLQNDEEYDAEVVGVAPEKDIAVLKINAPKHKLQPVTLGDSASLSVGRKVLAIGNPFALDTTLTVGVVSALGREIKSITNRSIKDVIQTDAAINPGNSGGPLLDSQGRLIGVNTAIYSPSGANAGIGFAIPVDTLKNIVPQLIKYGRLNRPLLGVELLSDSWARRLRTKGIAILSVTPGGPSAQVGMIGVREDSRGRIHLGDVIIAIDDEPVQNQDEMLEIIEKHKAGDVIKVTTIREEEIHNYDVTLAPSE